jgi:hypothetical protein
MRRAVIGLMVALTGALSATAPTAISQAATPAPKPPVVYGGYAEQITATSVTFKMRIDPEGSATTYYVQYGPTTAYGSQTSAASAGSGTQEAKLLEAVSGLQSDTLYHFRVVAISSAGTAGSVDATFTTKKISLSLSATATPNPVVFGAPLSISGTLSGTGNAGVEVVLQTNPFPYAHGFSDLTAPERTEASGNFSFPLAGLLESTQLRVATVIKPMIVSPVIVEPVTVRVTLHVHPTKRRGFVRLYGTVTPAEPGAQVAFERQQQGRFIPVSGTVVKTHSVGVSHFARTIRLRRRGLYRALVQVPNGGAQTAGRSGTVLVR